MSHPSSSQQNLYGLRIFLQIVESGSLTAAARKLDLSQPAVSSHLKQLESRYGKLMDRGRAGLRLTEKGREVVLAGQRIFGELDALRETPGGPLRGSVWLGASTFPAAYLLPSLLARFQREHPETDAELAVRPSTSSLQAVLNGDVGLAAVGEVAEHDLPDSLDSVCFGGDSLALFAMPAVAEQSLSQMRLFWRERGSSTRSMAERGLRRHLSEFASIREIGSAEAIRECVLVGLGVAFLSEQSVQRELGLGLLTRLTPPGLESKRKFFLVRRRDRTPSRLETAVWDFLRTPSS